MLTKDCWTHIFTFLTSSEILQVASTSRVMYRVCTNPLVKQKLAGGMIGKYKPNYSQWRIIEEIMIHRPANFWITGDVGVGKSVVGFVTCLKYRELISGIRNIIIVVPPNLIGQWDDLLKQQFGQEAAIIHSYNQSYSRLKFSTDEDIPYGIILTSNNIFKSKFRFWAKNSIILRDECREIETDYGFSVYIGISANVPSLYNIYKTYKVESNCQIEKLLPIKEIIYELPITDDHLLVFNDATNLTKPEIFLTYPSEYITGHINDRDYIKASLKFKTLLKILLDMNNEKAIVFDHSINYLPTLSSLLKQHGLSIFLFTTQDSPYARINILNNFRKAKKAVLLTSYKMMGEGHNLPEANHIIYFTACPTINSRHQTIGRCQRFKQSKQVFLHILCVSPLDFYLNFRDQYPYLFDGKSQKFKYKVIKDFLYGYGYLKNGKIIKINDLNLNALLERYKNPQIEVGSIGYVESTPFEVIAINNKTKALTIKKLKTIATITLRKDGRYHLTGTSTNSSEYYFC